MGRSGQYVYIHNSCISDGTLEDVIGELVGNTQQGMDGSSQPSLAIPGSPMEPNSTTSEHNLTVTECQSKHLDTTNVACAV